MVTRDDIAWFKTEFGDAIEAAIAGAPLSVDFLAALACQETGEIWPQLRKKGLPTDRILALCVGDVIDADSKYPRSAFPRTRAELETAPQGADMFAIARQALVDMAAEIPGYAASAAKPDKFCHGFGLFQLDLQFFRQDPDYFLRRKYACFADTLARCIGELRTALRKRGFDARDALTELELASVAITYNTGRYDPKKGLKQGYRNGQGVYYGEAVVGYLRLAASLTANAPPPAPGNAIVSPPTPVTAAGVSFRVDTQSEPLTLRAAPQQTAAGQKSNRIGLLPDGQIVRALDEQLVNGYRHVETSLHGALLRGYAADAFLVRLDTSPLIPVANAALVNALPAVWMPAPAGRVTTRMMPPSAASLNEAGQPGRQGATPDQLRQEIGAIIAWLAPDDVSHLRYQPTRISTFCNVYAHDLCHLAGVYLPRVWWTPAAIARIATGEAVKPVYGATIEEMRANGLFRWLRDFGASFGWRQMGELSKLQAEINQGGIGVIVARRADDGASGHIAMVVPETDANRARRNSAGEVTAPLQSQAGRTNFSYGPGRTDWWLGPEFAEHAFWIHA